MKVKIVPRKHIYTTTVYLHYTVNGTRVKERTEITWNNSDPKRFIEDQMIVAENLRLERLNEISHKSVGIYNNSNKERDFYAFAEDTAKGMDSKAEQQRIQFMLLKLKSFAGHPLLMQTITETFCRMFRNHLKETLSGETAYGYFRVFKSIIKSAVRKKLLPEDPTVSLPAIPKGSAVIKKEVLTPDDIILLRQMPCINKEVQRATFVQLRTGMGTAEIRGLRARQVDPKRMVITYTREKNKHKNLPPIVVPITRDTLRLLGDLSIPDRLLFTLPSKRYLNKILQDWVTAAGINKKITPYCMRHSCIQNLMDLKVPDSHIIEIVGHSDYRMLRRYARPSEEMKRESIRRLD